MANWIRLCHAKANTKVLQVDHGIVVTVSRQIFIRDTTAGAEQREDIHTTIQGTAGVIQCQAASASRERYVGAGRGYFSGTVRQDLPGHMDIIGGICDVDIAVKLNALQAVAITAK